MGNGVAVWTSRERMLSSAMAPNPSEKSRAVALALCIPLGVFGAHRFYVGKIGTGLLMLCTLGGLGLWYLYDLITIASGEFRDGDGRRVALWDPEDAAAMAHGVPQELLDEIESLRREVGELAERVDFTERLLSDPSRKSTSPGGMV
jgi:hypothetical protein